MDFDSLGCFYRVFGHWFCYHRRCILKSTEQFGSDSSHVEERHLPTTLPCYSQNATKGPIRRSSLTRQVASLTRPKAILDESDSQ